MSTLAAIIIAALAFPFLAMWRSYVVIVLWGWFVFPATKIAAPSIYVVYGMMMTLAMILPIARIPKQEGDALANYFESVISYGLLYPALALGTGWAWKWLQWGLT
jgi:hypothetical protein